jgi:hypothetical protein
MDRAAKTPFQRVVDELSGGCGCACHTGTGYRTSCEHCQPDSSPDRAAVSKPMRRYMEGEITATEYLRLIQKETAARVRREQRIRRWWR